MLTRTRARTRRPAHLTTPRWYRPPHPSAEQEKNANPSQLPVRTFHNLVAAGEYTGAVELTTEHDVDVNCTHGSEFNDQIWKNLGATVGCAKENRVQICRGRKYG